MTSSGQPQATPRPLPGDAEVTAFLRANPTFLDHHPELLAQLSIPHQSGDAVSLLERQVTVLREDNARLKQQFEDLVRYARENEALSRRIHVLALELMRAAGPQAVFSLLERSLSKDFGAERVASLVFAEAGFVDAASAPQFVGAGSARRDAFAAVLAAGNSACGALDEAQHTALFGPGPVTGSAVLMPLKGQSWDGVLAIASDDASRYEPGMGTEFLVFLKDIVTVVIDPWVKRGRPAGA